MKNLSLSLVFFLVGCAAETSAPDSRPSTGGKTDHYSRTSALANAGCPAPLMRVEEESDCLQDVSCYRMEDGAEVFFCTGDDPHVPECRDGLIRVESTSSCLQDDAVCEKVVRGEESYYCTGPSPLCPQGHHEVEQKTPSSISRWDQDGVERFCEPDDSFCDDGLERVEEESSCLQDAYCVRVDATGETYYCTGAVPEELECPAGLVRVDSQSGCLQDDAICQEVVYGELTYYCTGPDSSAS